jgi:hypothetical protein
MSEQEVHKILDSIRAVGSDRIIVIYSAKGVTRYAHVGYTNAELVTARNFLNNRLGRKKKPPFMAHPQRDERPLPIPKPVKPPEVSAVTAAVRRSIRMSRKKRVARKK